MEGKEFQTLTSGYGKRVSQNSFPKYLCDELGHKKWSRVKELLRTLRGGRRGQRPEAVVHSGPAPPYSSLSTAAPFLQGSGT